MKDDDNKWITQKEASEITGKTLNAIHQLTRNKRFRTKVFFGKKLVNFDDVSNFEPLKCGRPPKVAKQVKKTLKKGGKETKKGEK